MPYITDIEDTRQPLEPTRRELDSEEIEQRTDEAVRLELSQKAQRAKDEILEAVAATHLFHHDDRARLLKAIDEALRPLI